MLKTLWHKEKLPILSLYICYRCIIMRLHSASWKWLNWRIYDNNFTGDLFLVLVNMTLTIFCPYLEPNKTLKQSKAFFLSNVTYKRKLMQGINVAGKDCIDLFFNTHLFLTFISLNIHIMFSLRTNSRIFEIPHTHSRIILVWILYFLYLSI